MLVDRRHDPGRRRRVATAAVLACALLIPLLWLCVAQTGGPDDGTDVSLDVGSVVHDVAGNIGYRVDHVQAASALRPGDVVTAVDGTPVTATSFAHRRIGDVLDYAVTRGGRPIVVPVTLRAAEWRSRIRDEWSMYLLLLFLLPIAAYVFARRPQVRAAQLMLAAGSCFVIGTASSPLGARVIDLTGGRGPWVYVVAEIANAALWSVLLHFTLTFPEPSRLLSGRRWAVAAVYSLPAALYLLELGWLTLRGADPLAIRLAQVGFSYAAALVFPPLLVVSLLIAYRRSPDRATRQRMRWVVASLAGASALYFVLGQLAQSLTGAPLVGYDWLELLYAGGPIAIASAVLSHNLFDLRPTVRRWLVFVLLGTPLVALYVGALVIVSRALPTHSVFVALIAGGATALAFRLLHTVIQRFVSRLVYGVRDDPYEVVSRINRAVEDVSPSAVFHQLTETLAAALRLSYAAIELAADSGEPELVAGTGTPSSEHQVLPLHLRGHPPGRLLLAVGAGREPFGRADRRLLGELTDHIGRVVEVVLLNSALQRSRERIVGAQEEERRRLQQDLHDGIGPALAAQSMQLELARAVLPGDAYTAGEMLAKAARTGHEVMDEIRRVVDDLRPRVLGQLGLRTAIDERARSFSTGREGLDMTLAVRGELTDIPAATEVAAYRIATEAMANAARHARASSCRVALAAERGRLTVCVRDDGVGMTGAEPPGVGLWSMRERAQELGGQFRVESARDAGTHVHATLPLATTGSPG